MEGTLYALDDRALVSVTGTDAFPFLQNLVTGDVSRVLQGGMIYSCLLTAQGNFLHDFFILPHQDGYLLDCDRDGVRDLVRHLEMYRLRSRVVISEYSECRAYALQGRKEGAFADPRLPELGSRLYMWEMADSALPVTGYDDFCIFLGVPPTRAMKAGKDYLSDINLDLLGAVSWNKGCFVGQELTARMHHRGLAKRRLLIVTGEGLEAGDRIVRADDADMGEVRTVDSARKQGLAVLKLEALQGGIFVSIPKNKEVKISKPRYPLEKFKD